MVNIPKEVVDMLNDVKSTKVIASVDEKGMPNAAVVGSVAAVGEETVAYADIAVIHTKANLEKTKKASILVIKGFTAYQLKGICIGFQTSGPLFEEFTKKLAQFQMNVKGVVTIKIEEVFAGSYGRNSKKLA